MVEIAIAVPTAHPPDLVHIVSHGPHCLDGVTSAVAVARFHAGLEVVTRFANNPEINEAIQARPAPPAGTTHELWVTDISWNQPATDGHLRALAAAGTRIRWIDHHRTAIERLKRGALDVPLATMVVEDTYAASRLVFEHLKQPARERRQRTPSGDPSTPRRSSRSRSWWHSPTTTTAGSTRSRARASSRSRSERCGTRRRIEELLGVDADVT